MELEDENFISLAFNQTSSNNNLAITKAAVLHKTDEVWILIIEGTSGYSGTRLNPKSQVTLSH